MFAIDDVVAALDGQKVGRRNWRCLCPVHGGHSLYIREASDGRLLAYCFGAGCSFSEIIAELREIGLDDEEGGSFCLSAEELERRREAEIADIRRRILAARSFCRSTVQAMDTIVETYLRGRGITAPLPRDTLRFSPHAPHRRGLYFPAMIAAVTDVENRFIGYHATFLKPDGSGKIDTRDPELQRESHGPISGGAVRLGVPTDDRPLIVGEGIETVLSAMQLCDMPGWAALSTSGLIALELPSAVQNILIAADHDANGAGLRAAKAAEDRWKAEGRVVWIEMPATPGADFNDILKGRAQ